MTLGSTGCSGTWPAQPGIIQFTSINANPNLLSQLHSSFNTANSTLNIATGSDGYALFDLSVPSFASTLSLDLQFIKPGDGDWLEILFAGDLLGAYQGSILGTTKRTFLFAFSNYVGQTRILTFLLASSGPLAAEAQISNLQFQSAMVVTPAPVPVPASVWLLIAGLVGLKSAGRRRRTAL